MIAKVADYENQIAEMKQQIKDFAEETAESLYGINLKDWASGWEMPCMRHGRRRGWCRSFQK